MKLALIGGFLGSGKTTAIVNAAKQLIGGDKKVAVITNDQGDQQVDTALVNSLGLASGEVTNGCFCCNFDELEKHIDRLQDSFDPHYLFAESAGSCMDLVATLAKPITARKPGLAVVISVFADAELILSFLENRSSFLNDSVRYIYHNQLREADLLIVSKTDLVRPDDLEKIKRFIDRQHSDKIVLYHSSMNGDDISKWIQAINRFADADQRKSLELDYDVYAEGEASLAWLDRRISLSSPSSNAVFICEKLIGSLFNSIQQQRMPIGHLKFFIESDCESRKVSFTSAATSGNLKLDLKECRSLSVLINARIQTDPAQLSTLIGKITLSCEQTYGCTILTKSSAAFSPGYPKPTHRHVD